MSLRIAAALVRSESLSADGIVFAFLSWSRSFAWRAPSALAPWTSAISATRRQSIDTNVGPAGTPSHAVAGCVVVVVCVVVTVEVVTLLCVVDVVATVVDVTMVLDVTVVVVVVTLVVVTVVVVVVVVGEAKQAENSDVSTGLPPPSSRAAVAATTLSPVGSGKLNGPKATVQLASVVTTVEPRKCLPWPKPDEWHAGLEKNSRRNMVLGTLSKAPEIITLPVLKEAEITGEFW